MIEVRCYKFLSTGWTRARASVAFSETEDGEDEPEANEAVFGYTTGDTPDDGTWDCAYTTWYGGDASLRVELDRFVNASFGAVSVDGHYIVAYEPATQGQLTVRRQSGETLFRVMLPTRA